MDLTSQTVYLQRCTGYNEQELLSCFDIILSSSLKSRNLHSSRILLKPNLVTASINSLACTEGKFILAVAKWLIDHGADVSIGDSPAFGTTASVLNKIGIISELRKLSVAVTKFNKVTQVTLTSGLRAGMATGALDCDLLVNMPRVKAHAQLRVSLAVKNLFGCVVGMRKPLWHMKHGGCHGNFAEHLVELMAVLPDGVSLVDGVTAMHQTGPITGKPFSLGLVACSANPVAVDRALLAILGIKKELSPLMITCVKKSLGGANLGLLDFPVLCPDDLAVDSFVIPKELHSIRFNPFQFVKGSLRRILLKLGIDT